MPAAIDAPRPEPDAGVFETLLVVRGEPLELEAHLARLRASIEHLYGTEPPADARERLIAAAAGAELARMRIDVVPGAAEPAVKLVPIEIGIVMPPWERGLELVPVAVPGWNGAHKWADRRLLDAAEAAAAPGAPLIVDADGTLLEGTRANLFAVRGGVIVTPPADGRVLPGVTRGRVLELASGLGIEAREEALPRDALAGADEAFMTGTVRGVQPVRGHGGAEVPSGPVTARLQRALRELWLG
jgi:para-aminobenzoate synthetase/4-amino-4-deoxychorismate lyase